MDEWSDWVVEDHDPAEMIRQMRGVLADRRRSQDDKIEALTLLTNLADEASVAVLRWYNEHADPGMEIPAMLALMEADRLNRPPHFEPWHEVLLERVQEVGAELTAFGHVPSRALFRSTLAQALRTEGWRVEEGGQALLKYEGQLIDLAPLDLVVNDHTLVGFWDRADEEAAWGEFDSEEEAANEALDPLDHFYAILRTANLPWGVLVDMSSDSIFTDMVENLEMDRGIPQVEYILSLTRAVQ